MLKEIEQAENDLREAMLASDVEALDRLLASDLVFTNHLGMVFGKEDDLNAHRSGFVKIEKLELSDSVIRHHERFAVVTVQVFIDGSFGGNRSANTLRFTRVWSSSQSGQWQVVAGHSSIVSEQS